MGASKGRRAHPAVAKFEYNLETELVKLRDELENGTYRPGGYCNFPVHEPKRRIISAAPFRDRVVHHALVNVIGPPLERQFIFDSYANQVGKGTHRALDRCTYFLRRYEYVFPCDVTQFFPSIDHAILRGILARKIADERALNLIDQILASGEGILADEYDMVWFPGDNLFALQRPRGLPIGNLTSQFWANVYLNELDQFVKRKLKVRAYLRYVDDFLLFSNDKAQLWEWKAAIVEFLAGLRLTIHDLPAQPRPRAKGVTFLGFIIFPDHRRLRPAKGYAFQRRLRGMVSAWRRGELDAEDLRARAISWAEHISHGDTWNLKQAVFQHARQTHG
ncbi:MAG: reverse transcriptase domain-containing protein [Chloroflexota bacterium]